MEVFLDDNDQMGQGMPSFKPAGCVLARLSWPPLRPYVPTLLAAAQWKRCAAAHGKFLRVKETKVRMICTQATLVLAPHAGKLLQLQESEVGESRDDGETVSSGETLFLLVTTFIKRCSREGFFHHSPEDGLHLLVGVLLALPRDLLLPHLPEILRNVVSWRVQSYMTSTVFAIGSDICYWLGAFSC